MTDYQEEQIGEIETLRCIYCGDELTEISEQPYTFQINITSESVAENDPNAHTTVEFVLPETYPDVAPEMSIVAHSNLSCEQVEDLEALLQEQANVNLGMVMVYTLTSAVQARLGEFAEAFGQEQEQEKRRREEEERVKEEAKFHGTPVTTETFATWRKQFEQEVEKANSKMDQSQGKLTGRQMFERDSTLALSDAKFLIEGTEAEVEIDETLFQNLEDLEIEEDS